MPCAGRHSISRPFWAATASAEPKMLRWSVPITVTTPMSGRIWRRVSSNTSSPPLETVISTRQKSSHGRVRTMARSRYGEPWRWRSVLRPDILVASTAAMSSLVVVLPQLPVTPMTVTPRNASLR